MPIYNTILGTTEDDSLKDQVGNTELIGLSGDDRFSAGTVNGGFETNIFNGGSGEDRVSYSSSIQRIVASLENGSGYRIDSFTGQLRAHDEYVNVENIGGGKSDDSLTGNHHANGLYGGTGSDEIYGKGGNDFLDGGKGSDEIYGGAGNDRIQGNEGRTHDQSIDNDYYDGGSGSDFLYYIPRGEDDDIEDTPWYITLDLTAGFAHGYMIGHDTLVDIENVAMKLAAGPVIGSDANNTLLTGKSNDYVEGRDGDDRLHGQGGNDTLLGGHGNDFLEGGYGNNVLDGGAGSDTISIGTSTVWKGSYEVVDPYNYVNDLHAEIDLAAGTSTSTKSDGFLYSTDTLISVENAITFDGDDTINGSDVANHIDSGDGADVITAQGGHDTVLAGGGDDILEGGLGNDILDGGEGVDRLIYAPVGGGTVDLEAGTTSGILGNDILSGIEDVWTGSGHDTVIGDAGANEIKTQGGDDDIEAGGGDDVIHAGTGHDVIAGGAGDDDIFAAWGDDTVRGGAGNDMIALGPGGMDTLVWGQGDSIGTDEVLNFDVGIDQLEFGEGFLADILPGETMPGDVLRAATTDKGTFLEANIADSGWHAIARFDGLDVAQLESVIDHDTLITSTILDT